MPKKSRKLGDILSSKDKLLPGYESDLAQFYHPLAQLEFRLVRVLPGEWSDAIHIDLIPFSLELGKLPFYEAVSYTWGSPAENVKITCSGLQFQVGLSVEALIRRFRPKNLPRLLWIDAISIDQNNIQERITQVQIMNLIYQRANRVLIYLGEADADSDRAMDALAERLSTKASTQKIVLDFLEKRPWFSRVWVLQEVALAEVAIVICGSKCVSWACFPAWWARNAAALEHYKAPPSTFKYDPVALKRTSLLQQLYDTRFSNATNPRDKVYALIGLVSPEERQDVWVNYGLSVSAVYIHSAKAIIKNEESLRLLSGVQPGDRMENLPWENLPSWVPDWVQTSPIVSLGLSNHFQEPFDAGGSPACHVLVEDDAEYGAVLTCMGIEMDTVQQIGPKCRLKGSEGSLVSLLNEWAYMAPMQSVHQTPWVKTFRPSMKRIIHGSGQFWPVDVQSETIWPTVLAQASPTVELSPSDLRKRNSRPAKIEDLKFCLGRRLFTTPSGFIGLAPAATQKGDLIVVLLGAPVPQVLRPRDGTHYTLIGECYVNGIMGGEALAHLETDLKEMGHRCRPHNKSLSDSPLRRFSIM